MINFLLIVEFWENLTQMQENIVEANVAVTSSKPTQVSLNTKLNSTQNERKNILKDARKSKENANRKLNVPDKCYRQEVRDAPTPKRPKRTSSSARSKITNSEKATGSRASPRFGSSLNVGKRKFPLAKSN